MNRWPVVRLLLALTGVCASACSTLKVAEPPPLLSWSEQLDVREAWLVKRHEMLLPRRSPRDSSAPWPTPTRSRTRW
jgi:hypothetical protein